MKKYAVYFSQSWTIRTRIDHLVVYQDFAQKSLKKSKRKLWCRWKGATCAIVGFPLETRVA
jgi:hypothetical protein